MTVLILGAGVMQLPAIDLARELGWKVAVADGNPAAPGAERCDRFFPVDLKDREGLLAAASELRASSGLDAVFTAGTDFSANVAWLASRLGLPGHDPEAALAASDKLLMRARFSAAGLPSPRFAECSSVDSLESSEGITALGFPLVVKPADNMGARGCRLVRDRGELEAAVVFALPLSRTGRAIVEEYVEGPEFSIDALVYDERIEIRVFADRHIAFAPYFVELGHTLPSTIDGEIRDRVVATFKAGVEALGLSHGAAKGDMKWDVAAGRPSIGEIAARLSGGYMSGWTYPYASGVDLTRDALGLAAGLRPEGARQDRGWCSAERAFISIPGRVASIEGLREARNAPYIKDLFLRTSVGEEVVFPSNNVEKCGNVISQAPDRSTAAAAAEDAARSVLIRLAAPNDATAAFLSGGSTGIGVGEGWPPEAFALDPKLESALEALPLGARDPGPGAELAVLRFPEAEISELRDWAGRTLGESARLALERAGARLVELQDPGSPSAVGRPFWKALVAGGVQGGLYVLDCLRRGAELP